MSLHCLCSESVLTRGQSGDEVLGGLLVVPYALRDYAFENRDQCLPAGNTVPLRQNTLSMTVWCRVLGMCPVRRPTSVMKMRLR